MQFMELNEAAPQFDETGRVVTEFDGDDGEIDLSDADEEMESDYD